MQKTDYLGVEYDFMETLIAAWCEFLYLIKWGLNEYLYSIFITNETVTFDDELDIFNVLITRIMYLV